MMAKAKRKSKARYDGMAPTPEQIGAFETSWQIADGQRAQAYRRIPVIVTLANTGKLTPRQFNGLCRYRDVALACDRSPLPDSVGRLGEVRGHSEGSGLPPALLRAEIELGCLERALGGLWQIARAVAVDDVTLSQWAMEKGGSVMRERSLGKKVITWFEPRRAAHKMALLEVRMAGERLAAEIGA